MIFEQAEARNFASIRALAGQNGAINVAGPQGCFPVYRDLVDSLMAEPQGQRSALAAHVCAVLSGWAYGDAADVATVMLRLGLEFNRVRRVSVINDAMFITSHAFVVQSKCGRVIFLCYRGTEPVNPVSWLTDADVNPTKLWVPPDLVTPLPANHAILHASKPSESLPRVHHGFYLNQRASWFEVENILARALEGQSILDPTVKVNPPARLYVTGHSLGGAMAVIAVLRMLLLTQRSAGIAKLLRVFSGLYTYGQPMVGNSAFAKLCQAQFPALSSQLYRHIFAADVVPCVPPHEAGDFAHTGDAWECEAIDKPWTRQQCARRASTVQFLGAFLSLIQLSQLPAPFPRFLSKATLALLRAPPRRGFSIYDHGPNNYITALTPADKPSEFGDF